MGLFQLGRIILDILSNTPRLFRKPSFQRSAKWRRIRRYEDPREHLQRLLINGSYMHRSPPLHNPKHLPRKNRPPLRQTLLHPGRPPLLQLHRKRPPPHRPLLVRLVQLPLHPLDRAHHRRRRRHYGHLLSLPRRLQLSRRHVSSLCKLGVGGAIFLSEYAGRRVSACDGGHVSSDDVCGSEQLFGWCRCCADYCALGAGIFWAED